MFISSKFFVLFLYIFIYLALAKTKVTENHLQERGALHQTAVKSSESNFSFLITGGYISKTHNLTKYVVSIRRRSFDFYWGDNHFCAGSIIARNIILTAAHCVVTDGVTINVKDFYIVSGVINRFEETQNTRTHEVSRILAHSRYKFLNIIWYDIALLFLKDDLELDNFRAIVPLMDREVTLHDVCTAIGWGSIFFEGPLAAEILYVDLKRISLLKCILSVLTGVLSGNICFKDHYDGVRGTCQGDSGGPVFCDGKVAGITSHGAYCGMGYPDIATDVYYFRNWIHANAYWHALTKILLLLPMIIIF